MPNLRRLLPFAVALTLLAGCGDGPTLDSLASGHGGTPPGTAAPTAAPSPGSSSGTIPPGQEGDTPPSDAPTDVPPTPTASIIGACSLVTRTDIINVTRGYNLEVSFPADPQEETGVYPLHGARSKCQTLTESRWIDATGTATVGGEVDVRIQDKGSDEFFPPRPGDVEIPGLGVQALSHYSGVCVLLDGGGLLVVEAAISSPAADQSAQIIKWGTELAKIALSRLANH
jgi:hypothetical protein